MATRLNLGEKGDGLTEGANTSDEKLIEYALNDVELCRKIYRKLEDYFPESEKQLIHITNRWGVEPTLQIDIPRVSQALLTAINERQDIIEASEVPEKTLTSNKQFEAYLINEGIEVPMKDSASGWPIPALAKNDPEFHRTRAKYPTYDHIFAGRLAAKSNIEVSRSRTILTLAQSTKNHLMPMPLKYYGAHTGRWSGTDGLNVQNFPRGGELRKSLIAPKGHVIVVADSAQIELRVNCWFSLELNALDRLRRGEDLYKETAAVQFSVLPGDVTKQQRQFGKVVALGCGYGMGHRRFRDHCAGGPLGMAPLILSEPKAAKTIQLYRNQYWNIRQSWRKMDECISYMNTMVDDRFVEWRAVRFYKELAEFPNGMNICYPNIHNGEEGGWLFDYGKSEKKLYGAKLQENLVQGLARVVIADQLLEIEKLGLRTVSTTHDEILAVVKESEAEDALKEMLRIMSTSPEWAPDLPLGAEGGYAKEYSK
jgi:DNA polymerase